MKINVPTSWASVTLREYQAITALFKESEEKGKEAKNKELHDYHTECALISALTGEDMDEILSLHRGAHNSIMNEWLLEFLYEDFVFNLTQAVFSLANLQYLIIPGIFKPIDLPTAKVFIPAYCRNIDCEIILPYYLDLFSAFPYPMQITFYPNLERSMSM